jgi:ribonuclease HI
MGKKLGGTMQMDMTYATVPVFGGENKRLYRETKFSYVVSDQNNYVNHPIYVVDEDLVVASSQSMKEYKEALTLANPVVIPSQETNGIWKMYFDGAYSKEGVGAGVVLISPKKEEIHLSYKLEFEATNNVDEYEALILGLEAARKMQITELVVFGDSKLVVQQIKVHYQTRHPRMRAYKNQVWDLIDNFYKDFNITLSQENLTNRLIP